MSSNVMPFPATRADQVAAELRRVEASLFQAGFSLQAFHGTSDAGDPWVTFCDPETHDVIVQVELVHGEVVATGPAFISPFKMQEIRAGVERLLRKLKIHHGLRNSSHIWLTVMVALAISQAAETDAANAIWPGLDTPDGVAIPALNLLAMTAIVERVLQAVQWVNETAPADAPMPEEADQAPQDGADASHGAILPADAPGAPAHLVAAYEALAVDIADQAVVIEVPAADATAVQALVIADAVVDVIEAPADAGEPAYPSHDEIRAVTIAFLEQAASSEVVAEHGSVRVYGYGAEGSHEFHLADGSSLMLIGVPAEAAEAW